MSRDNWETADMLAKTRLEAALTSDVEPLLNIFQGIIADTVSDVSSLFNDHRPDEALALLRARSAVLRDVTRHFQEGIRALGSLLQVLQEGEIVLSDKAEYIKDYDAATAQFSAGITAADAAESVLRSTGEAMRARDIVNEVLCLGYSTDATRPYAVISNALRFDARFVKVARGVYGLATWDDERGRGKELNDVPQ